MKEQRPADHRAVHPDPLFPSLSSDGSSGWTLVLPLKGGSNAKSRLGAPPYLASAIALDCLEAVLASPLLRAVRVVTPDPELAARAAAAGAEVRTESTPGNGLLAAVTDGLRGQAGRCAVLLGDLPALRPEDLDAALTAAGTALGGEPPRPPMAFVPDAEGTGTVLLTALSAAAMQPSFGPASAASHQNAGAVRLDLDLPRLRRDVDTRADLRTAVALGIGPRTTSALRRLEQLAENRA